MVRITSNMDEFQHKLREMAERARALHGHHQIPFNELFTDAFMRRHTQFASFDALLQQSGFKVETTEDFARIPDDQWDQFIAAHTSFASWQAMQKAAVEEWTAKQLGL